MIQLTSWASQLTLWPTLVLDHDAGSPGLGESASTLTPAATCEGYTGYTPLNCSSYIHRATISGITISDDGNGCLSSDLLDLACNFLKSDIASIRETKSRGHCVSSKEDDGEPSFLAQTRAQSIVAADVCDNLGGVIMCLLHHGSKT